MQANTINNSKALLLAFGFACLSFGLAWSFGGARAYPWQLLLTSKTAELDSEIMRRILLDIRLPRVICACLVGGALAAAGVITQGLFRNPLASPSVLGISSGGVLGAILAFYYGLNYWGLWSIPIFAFIACLLTTLLILRFAGVKSTSFAIEDLLLIGFAINGILSSASSFLLSLALNDFDKAPAMMNWMLGTLSGKTWEHCWVGIGPIVISILLTHRLAYRFNILSLGSDIAQTLGLDLKKLRIEAILLMAVLVASSVAIGGLMPFIGLLVPHLSRMMVGPDHRQLLSISVINGMSLVMLADLIARIIMPPQEIQVGVLIAMLGSPFFLWMLYQHRRRILL